MAALLRTCCAAAQSARTTRDQPGGTAGSSGSRPTPPADRKRRREQEEELGACPQLVTEARASLVYKQAGGWPDFAALQGRRGTTGWLLAIPAEQRATFAVLPPSPTAFAAIFPSTITGDNVLRCHQ